MDNEDMKDELINQITASVWERVGAEHAKIVQQTLYVFLTGYELRKSCTEVVVQNHDETAELIKRFLIAKKIKGCTDRTLTYYRQTLVAIFSKIGKSPMQTETDDIRVYIAKRQMQDKIKALRDIIDTAGSPVLVFYGYRHERERLLQEFKARELKTGEDIDDWNDGRVPVMLAHPASVGYGLNLQAGGHVIVWYSLPWSLELYQQANARLYRQGQTEAVIINHLIAAGTVDEQVLESLKRKDTGQAALMAALRERREGID